MLIECKLVLMQLRRMEILPQRVTFLGVITVGVNMHEKRIYLLYA